MTVRKVVSAYGAIWTPFCKEECRSFILNSRMQIDCVSAMLHGSQLHIEQELCHLWLALSLVIWSVSRNSRLSTANRAWFRSFHWPGRPGHYCHCAALHQPHGIPLLGYRGASISTVSIGFDWLGAQLSPLQDASPKTWKQPYR